MACWKVFGLLSKTDDELRDFLKERPDCVRARNEDGDTPLHVGLRRGYLTASRVLEEEFGASKKSRNDAGETPIDVAQKVALNYIDKLIEEHEVIVEVERLQQDLRTPQCYRDDIIKRWQKSRRAMCDDFFQHAYEGSPELLKAYKRAPTCAFAVDKKGDTALHIAVRRQNLEVRQFLLQVSDLAATNNAGLTALDLEHELLNDRFYEDRANRMG